MRRKVALCVDFACQPVVVSRATDCWLLMSTDWSGAPVGFAFRVDLGQTNFGDP